MDYPNEDTRIGTGSKRSFSLREYIGAVTIAMLTLGLITSAIRLRRVNAELTRLHAELGYLAHSLPGQIAAARAPSDQPLTYKVRIRVPSSPKFRISYSSILPQDSNHPDWYGAVAVPAGESTLTLRIYEDPRDDQWKILAIVSSAAGTRRMGTVLPKEHEQVFRGSHEAVSTGIGRETVVATTTASIRLLDERWLVGEGGLLLYGDRAPQHDQVGIYAELQPDSGPL